MEPRVRAPAQFRASQMLLSFLLSATNDRDSIESMPNGQEPTNLVQTQRMHAKLVQEVRELGSQGGRKHTRANSWTFEWLGDQWCMVGLLSRSLAFFASLFSSASRISHKCLSLGRFEERGAPLDMNL